MKRKALETGNSEKNEANKTISRNVVSENGSENKEVAVNYFNLALWNIIYVNGAKKKDVLESCDKSLGYLINEHMTKGDDLIGIMQKYEDEFPIIIDQLSQLKLTENAYPALNWLAGFMNFNGLGCNKNYKEARKYFTQASSQGDSRSIFEFACILMHIPTNNDIGSTLENCNWLVKTAQYSKEDNLMLGILKNTTNQYIKQQSQEDLIYMLSTIPKILPAEFHTKGIEHYKKYEIIFSAISDRADGAQIFSASKKAMQHKEIIIIEDDIIPQESVEKLPEVKSQNQVLGINSVLYEAINSELAYINNRKPILGEATLRLDNEKTKKSSEGKGVYIAQIVKNTNSRNR